MAAHANWKGFRLGADPIGLVRFRAARLDLELFRAGSSGLDAPQAIASPFDRLFPEWALYPLLDVEPRQQAQLHALLRQGKRAA
jgi:hypothetical protein